jgi:hypothetical protein
MRSTIGAFARTLQLRQCIAAQACEPRRRGVQAERAAAQQHQRAVQTAVMAAVVVAGKGLLVATQTWAVPPMMRVRADANRSRRSRCWFLLCCQHERASCGQLMLISRVAVGDTAWA